MDRAELKDIPICPSPELSAYIDGELSSMEELELEAHLAECRTCADDLNLQKNFLNALDSSLDDEIEIELPKNFTKSVVANAESRVRGLRHPHEWRSAAFICSALILFSLFALGSNVERTLVASAAVIEKLIAVVVAIGHVVYDIALGFSIVLKSLASKFLFESGGPALVFIAIFVLSLYLFSRRLRLRRT
jgi:anti-sigma factor RsiW